MTDQLLSDLRVDCKYSTLQVLSLRNVEQSLAANSCDFEVYSGDGGHDIIASAKVPLPGATLSFPVALGKRYSSPQPA